jgi:hypothetical protein
MERERVHKWWRDSFVDDKYKTRVSHVSSSTYNWLTGGVKYENRNPIWCSFQSGACYAQGDYFGIFGDIKPLRLYQNRERKGKSPFDTSSLHPPKSIIFSENPTSQRLKLRTNEVTLNKCSNDFTYVNQTFFSQLTIILNLIQNSVISLKVQVCFIWMMFLIVVFQVCSQSMTILLIPLVL